MIVFFRYFADDASGWTPLPPSLPPPSQMQYNYYYILQRKIPKEDYQRSNVICWSREK